MIGHELVIRAPCGSCLLSTTIKIKLIYYPPMAYKLLDSGHELKLEQFGEIVLIRPAAHALWSPKEPQSIWDRAHGRFSREGKNQWELFKTIPPSWVVNLHGIKLILKRTDFGHLGLFPEHVALWPWLYQFPLKGARILNLFAYSGATTMALAAQGAHVTHLDAAKGMVQWARENALQNQLENAPIRWIVDDVRKYLTRAIKREERYDAILLDPPSFGRGKVGELFIIERDLPKILSQCRSLLSACPLFFLCTSHTLGLTPLTLQHLLSEVFSEGVIEAGEMKIEGPYALPSGTYARWRP